MSTNDNYMDPTILTQLVSVKMPFGKYKDVLLCDLPVS
ncbi:MAG: putative quorum-sensing-regulated virulence factor, partial [Chitinophagaceae bacterium]|nr:putative quorum-sensing-regulated virulence factor [Chitinophagaceae bacterium]